MTETDAALARAFAGDILGARRLFAELRDGFRAADDAPGQGGALVTWGIAEERAGDPELAAEVVRQGAEIWEQHLGGHLPGWGWFTAADMYDAIGDQAAAERGYVRARRVMEAAGDTRGLGLCAAKSAQRGG
jgi:hypothetical protein